MSPNGHRGRRAAQNPPNSPDDELPRISQRPAHFSGTSTRAGDGAGDGNRTHVSSLGSCSSTIELHPRGVLILRAIPAAPQAGPFVASRRGSARDDVGENNMAGGVGTTPRSKEQLLEHYQVEKELAQKLRRASRE